MEHPPTHDRQPEMPASDDAVARSSAKAVTFGLLLLFSGFCGISYEVLYARILSNFIGDQFAVSAAVLLTFLVGIGFGTLYAHRFWRYLWLIEGAVGLCGVIFALGVSRFGIWLYSGTFLHGGLTESVLVCVLFLGIPAFLIGCSLPLFGGYLARLGSARAFARAYSVYNVGAGLTVLAIEFLLLRIFGIRTTVLVMATINGAIAIGLFFGFPRLRSFRPDPPARAIFRTDHLAALAIASVGSAIFQLMMVRLAECVIGPFRETFAIVLALILLGIAIGSAIVDRWKIEFGIVILAALAGLAWLVGGFGLIAFWYASLRPWAITGYTTTVLLKFCTLALMMALPAVAFGATIPTLLRTQGDVARDSGKLLFVSSVANGLGFLLMAFVLHQRFDYGILLLIIAGLSCLAALIYQRFRGSVAVAAAVLFIAAVGLHRAKWDEQLLYLGHTNFFSAPQLKEARSKMGTSQVFKGYQDVFSLIETGDDVDFFINGFVSVELGSPPEKLVAALPATLAPRDDRALVIGVGTGMTSGSAGLLFDRVDAVEINPVVISNLWRMKRWNFDIESMKNVHIIVDDGIHHIRASREKYTVIMNTVTTPLYFSSSKLYTHDFFEAVKQRLTPDGLYVTWVDTRVGDRGLDIILRTLHATFKSCWIAALRSQYFLLIASPGDIGLHHPRAAADSPVLAKYLYEQVGLPPEWVPYGLLSTQAFDLITDPDVPVNTLDYPVLEFEIARTGEAKIDRFKKHLVDKLSYVDVASALKAGMDYDTMDHTLYLELLLGDCDIMDKWEVLVKPTSPDFLKQYRRVKMSHLASWALFGNTAEAHSEYAWALNTYNQTKAAVSEYRKAIELDPKCQSCRVELGGLFEDAGDLDSATREYETILQRWPNDPDGCLGMGRVLIRRGRFNEALDYLAKSAAYYQSAAEPSYYIGEALEGLGRKGDALASYEHAAAVQPDFEKAQIAVSRITGRPLPADLKLQPWTVLPPGVKPPPGWEPPPEMPPGMTPPPGMYVPEDLTTPARSGRPTGAAPSSGKAPAPPAPGAPAAGTTPATPPAGAKSSASPNPGRP
jgi:spermidine synthase